MFSTCSVVGLRIALATVVAMGLAMSAPLAQEGGQNNAQSERPNGERKRPQLRLRAQPAAAVAPARIVLTAEITGGDDDFEEYYCPTIEWNWGDGTISESTSDCEPYVAGETQIKRRYTVQHRYQTGGSFKVYFNIKRNDKPIASTSTIVQIQPGMRP
jgi:hypothetical protein